MPDWSRRSGALEWLDTATPARDERAAYFRSLAFFNRAMLGHRPVLSWLAAATRGRERGAPLTLLDVGCGYGDLLRALRRFGRRYGVPLRLIGVDIDADTIAIARDATAQDDGIDYLAADVLNLRPSFRIDFVVSSLVAHHLDETRLTALLRWMETHARCGWLVADLERHAVPYHAIGVAARLMRVHPMVVKDGQISVTRALTAREWRPLLAAAGIDPQRARIDRFLYRCAVSRVKDQPPLRAASVFSKAVLRCASRS